MGVLRSWLSGKSLQAAKQAVLDAQHELITAQRKVIRAHERQLELQDELIVRLEEQLRHKQEPDVFRRCLEEIFRQARQLRGELEELLRFLGLLPSRVQIIVLARRQGEHGMLLQFKVTVPAVSQPTSIVKREVTISIAGEPPVIDTTLETLDEVTIDHYVKADGSSAPLEGPDGGKVIVTVTTVNAHDKRTPKRQELVLVDPFAPEASADATLVVTAEDLGQPAAPAATAHETPASPEKAPETAPGEPAAAPAPEAAKPAETPPAAAAAPTEAAAPAAEAPKPAEPAPAPAEAPQPAETAAPAAEAPQPAEAAPAAPAAPPAA